MKKLKLYVWEKVLTNYTSGVMFALAENAEHARKLICESECINFESTHSTVKNELNSEPKEYSVPVGYAVWGGA
ncbi:MAG: hypothetical protein WC389_19890 [Lutibacter sp.]|jgi:hypothetical protein